MTESDIRQSGLAVTKRAYRIYQERGYEAVLLVAALRGDYHLTELAGARLLMSIAPAAQEWFIARDHPREERIERAIAADVLERLLTMPEFVKAYEPDGMAPGDFISYGRDPAHASASSSKPDGKSWKTSYNNGGLTTATN